MPPYCNTINYKVFTINLNKVYKNSRLIELNPIFALSSRILQWIPTERGALRGGKIDEDKVKIKQVCR